MGHLVSHFWVLLIVLCLYTQQMDKLEIHFCRFVLILRRINICAQTCGPLSSVNVGVHWQNITVGGLSARAGRHFNVPL